MTSPALFVVSNNQLICFLVTLQLRANCVLIGILSPSFLFPLEVIFQHCHYPSVIFPLPVFFFPVTISFFVFFCPSDLTFLSLKPSLWSHLILFSFHILLSFVESCAISPTLYLNLCLWGERNCTRGYLYTCVLVSAGVELNTERAEMTYLFYLILFWSFIDFLSNLSLGICVHI